MIDRGVAEEVFFPLESQRRDLCREQDILLVGIDGISAVVLVPGLKTFDVGSECLRVHFYLGLLKHESVLSSSVS